MTLSPRRGSTVADLIRVLVAWLAAIVLVQGIAAAQALGQGPLHRHRVVMATADLAAGHHHDDFQRHVHEVADPSVLRTVADRETADLAAHALTVAWALMLWGALRPGEPDSHRRHVWHAAPGWAWRTIVPPALRRPPRV